MEERLLQYQNELRLELERILRYWMTFAIDDTHGGFVGKIDHDNRVYPGAPKGSVLHSRILWSFSAAYNLTRQEEYLEVAKRAFRYLHDWFYDAEYGGVYWTVDCQGRPLDSKKQIYALSFAVYGISEYVKATGDATARTVALQLYKDIVRHSYDEKNGGYIEALARDWKAMHDWRLSDKDANEKKSMNTHLHVLEAFTNLHRVWPDEELRLRISELIHLFLNHIISRETAHLILFFDEEWQPKSSVISYGHDIEAAWLVQEAAERVKNNLLLMKVKNCSVQLARAAAKGLDTDGGLWYEYDVARRHLVRQKHSWPQAEAMVGFFHAWQHTGEEKFLQQSLKSWQFIQRHMQDKAGGEWYWGVYEDYSPMRKEDKVGIWKCPYHNSRACIEIIQRIHTLLDSPL